MIFPLLETIGKKKFNYNEKTKKKLVQEFGNLLLHDLYCGEQWQRQGAGLGIRRGLGAWAGLGQCTRCTRPIFDPF